MWQLRSAIFLLLAAAVSAAAQGSPSTAPPIQDGAPALDLPTSKRLSAVPGTPQRINSLPISMALSPDGRYAVTVNAGFGTFESGYRQSLAVLDVVSGKVTDFPEAMAGAIRDSKETLYSGLQFSHDGRHVYASLASLTAPAGDGGRNPGSGILVYRFDDGRLTRDRILSIPLQHLAGARRTRLIGQEEGAVGVPYPASLAIVPGKGPERLLIADNLSDDVLLMNTATGVVLHRFDLSESNAVPSTYPIAVAVTPDGKRGFVALWNASEIVELDLVHNIVGRHLALAKPKKSTRPGSHPCALELSPDGSRLYVALSNRDAVAAIGIEAGALRTIGLFDARLPGQSYFGAEPEALALSPDGTQLYVGEAATDAVAVLDTRKMTPRSARRGMVEPEGFVPTEWMPMSMAAGHGLSAGKLLLATAKGRGTGPNNRPQAQTAEQAEQHRPQRGFTYIGTLLHGSLATLDLPELGRNLKQMTASVVADNRIRAGEKTIHFVGGASAGYENGAARMGPIRHVIYIIKENRTYDQILGDLQSHGKQVGDGDPSLTMYGAEITPNQHKLALQFGVLDNFFDSGEVSGDGHVWSNAAIGTDYLEKTWEQNYRNGQRTYDFEGMVAEGYPLLQHISDVNEPASGYLWGNLAAHGRTLYHFGEYISSTFCNELSKPSTPVPSQEGPMVSAVAGCARKEIAPGEMIPAEWGGGRNLWPWAIPLLASNIATKPELIGHFAPEAPDFNLRVPDQIRVNIFLRHLEGWKQDRARGIDSMPNFIQLRLPDDHTGGTTPGGPTPKSSIADNDLAIGRAVEAISHSAFWDDTAFFILEDDAQNGADHVDAHRSLALVVSKYAPHGSNGAPLVDSEFYSTVSTIRTMETLLGLPPMNNNDAFSSVMSTEFSGPGDQAPFKADISNRDNHLIYTANAATAPGAGQSSHMDFRHADRADPRKLNAILWRDAMGSRPVPMELMRKGSAKKDDANDSE